MLELPLTTKPVRDLNPKENIPAILFLQVHFSNRLEKLKLVLFVDQMYRAYCFPTIQYDTKQKDFEKNLNSIPAVSQHRSYDFIRTNVPQRSITKVSYNCSSLRH